MTFSELNLIQPLLDALNSQGYSKPSPIQEKVLPLILEGKDVMAAAQTGTGKTAGFTLPMLQKLADGTHRKSNQARALVLTPTRELAEQVHQSVMKYAANLPLKSTVAYGGVKINPQMIKLRKGTDILVATPGRLLDLMNQNAVKFDDLQFLVLDEADRMLDMGFMPDIKRIISRIPKERQTLLFSATFSKEIKKVASQFLIEPVSVEASPANTTATLVKQWIHPVDKKRKAALLSYLVGHNRWTQLLVFVRTRRGANKLSYDLIKNGIKAAAIHGDKSQGARNKALADFKSGRITALVATDIAARGLDINQMPLVVNFDLPNVSEDYVHRIGRTGRAGEKGQAVSLVSADEVDHLRGIQNLIKEKLERIIVDGFEPMHTVPDAPLQSVKKKKPHKKKMAKANMKSEHSKSNGKKRTSSSAKGKPSGNRGGQKTNSSKGTKSFKPKSKPRNKPSSVSGNKAKD